MSNEKREYCEARQKREKKKCKLQKFTANQHCVRVFVWGHKIERNRTEKSALLCAMTNCVAKCHGQEQCEFCRQLLLINSDVVTNAYIQQMQ
jgi:hypothetical protein